MKMLLATVLLTSSTAFASLDSDSQVGTVEMKTLITCQQSDGDFWFEVGVVPYKKGLYKMILVAHNGDDGSNSVIASDEATLKRNGNTLVFNAISKVKDFTLKVSKKGQDLRGSMWYQEYGPAEGIGESRMDCYKDSTIEYDSAIGLEPRISVGN